MCQTVSLNICVIIHEIKWKYDHIDYKEALHVVLQAFSHDIILHLVLLPLLSL